MFKKYDEVKIGQQFVYEKRLFTKVLGSWVVPQTHEVILHLKNNQRSVYVLLYPRNWLVIWKYFLKALWLQLTVDFTADGDFYV